MSVVKVVELVGESPNSWDEAVRNAVSSAAKTIRNLVGVEVLNWTADIEGDLINSYRANVKVAFIVDDSKRGL